MKLFGQHVPAPILMLAAAEYVLSGAAFLAVASALLVDELTTGNDVLLRSVVFGGLVIVGLTSVGLYESKQRLRFEGVVLRLITALAIAVLGLWVLALPWPLMEGSGVQIWLASFLLSLALLGIARVLFLRFVDHEALRRRVLIFGAGQRAASLLKLRRSSDQRGFKIAGFLPAPGDAIRLSDDRVFAAMPERLIEFVKEHRIDEIVVAMDDRRSGFPVKDLLECRLSGVAVVDLLTFLERETGKVKVDLLNPAWLIFSEGFSVKQGHKLSRLFDLVVSVVLAVLALPLLVIVALAILLEDGRPILYRQRRVGLGGNVFTLYKFRSMVKDAEADGEARWARPEDSRITRVGKWIRKLRFDELPQLFNVIRGDMSFVGPRPERPEFVERLCSKIPYYHERHTVKPGITGWAQLRYPYGSSDEDAMEKLQYDLYYIKHRNLAFDLMVILQTVEVVVWGKGAR